MRRFAWATLVWNVLTILMGAVVRATGSGAGCGRSWPTCQGELVPELAGATAIEFTHRAVSGVALVLVLVLMWWALRAHEEGHPVRPPAWLAGAAIVAEALIGALIVLAEWVADDASVARAIAVPLHLVSTFVLLAALTAIVALVGSNRSDRPWTGRGGWFWLVAVGMVLMASTGAITALADTLFPKEWIGIERGEHFLTGLRVVHPIVAVIIGLGVVGWLRHRGAGGRMAIVGWLLLVQLVLGGLNVVFGTPLWLSLLHLLVADVLWITWIWIGIELGNTGSRASEPPELLVAE